jgi:predicted nucleic acid-binding protein
VTGDPPVVTDTGPLTHLGQADALDLLDQFGPLLVPEAVFAELRVGGLPAGIDAVDRERRSVEIPDDHWQTLDAGERAALALCRRVDGTLLTDDLDARKKADELGIEVHGSIGIVLAAYADGLIDDERARATIRALESDSTLYLTRALVDRAIDRIDDGGPTEP